MSDDINDQLVLVSGESGTGKSACLMNLPNQERVMYLNCESGKRLPFRNKFKSFTITDPYQIYEAFEETQPGGSLENEIDVIVIDTLTFMMDMFESVHVINSDNTMAAWGEYAQFFKNLMQDHVASSNKSVICLGHTKSEYDEKAMEYRTKVPVKGALQNNGIEAFFSTVVSTKKVLLKDLEDYHNDMLNITEEDEMLGYKHVFQTKLTKSTTGERIRSPMGMFTKEESFIDNDAHILLNHLKEYYG